MESLVGRLCYSPGEKGKIYIHYSGCKGVGKPCKIIEDCKDGKYRVEFSDGSTKTYHYSWLSIIKETK